MLNRFSSDSPLASPTLVELLSRRTLEHPERRAFTFLIDGEREEGRLTYRELDRRARAIGAMLQQYTRPGERALLIYQPGLEFITAFFGCLYGGVIAVPTYPPQTRARRGLNNLRAIANDVQPAAVLTTSSVSWAVESLFTLTPDLQTVPLITTDHTPDDLADAWQDPRVSDDTLAFFQYTSGSSGAPKGVMLTHGNLMCNLSLIRRYFEVGSDLHGLIWLPPYHDMGLIGGVLQILYCGGQSTIMPPAAFLQRPIRWLQAISRTRATTSGGPNFAYDFCIRKSTPEQRAELDLSCWKLAFNGAEAVRPETIERFCETFGPCGFPREAFYPCYGMAEATLIVSGGQRTALPIIRAFQAAPLEQNLVVEAPKESASTRTLVGCGQTLAGQKILIVNPETCIQCPPNQVGEIWISGPSISQGYWRQPEATRRTFHAYLVDTGEGPFLRTGDLGFLQDGELFITGRRKELIIIRGRNHYPRDIELTVEQSHEALRPGCGAAFSVDVAGEERLVIVQEVERQHRHTNVNEMVEAIRHAIAEEHMLQVYAIVLVKTSSVPKTSSGKIQRFACREGFLAHTLDVVGEWIQHIEDDESQQTARMGQLDRRTEGTMPSLGTQDRTAAAIQTWLLIQLARSLGLPEDSINIHEPLVHYGMDSVQAVSMVGDLESWLGRRLPSTLAYDYPTIAELTHYLSGEPGNRVDADLQVDGEDAEALLANLDQLSDDEVDSLLQDLLEEESDS